MCAHINTSIFFRVAGYLQYQAPAVLVVIDAYVAFAFII
jgi:hypothetical protein